MLYWPFFRLLNYQRLRDFLKHTSAYLSNYFKDIFPTHWSFFLTVQLHHISMGDEYFPFLLIEEIILMLFVWEALFILDLSVCFILLSLSQFGVALSIEMFLQLMTKIFYNQVLSAWLNQVLGDQLHLKEVTLYVEGAVGKSSCRGSKKGA